jgi:hypothetical protein
MGRGRWGSWGSALFAHKLFFRENGLFFPGARLETRLRHVGGAAPAAGAPPVAAHGACAPGTARWMVGEAVRLPLLCSLRRPSVTGCSTRTAALRFSETGTVQAWQGSLATPPRHDADPDDGDAPVHLCIRCCSGRAATAVLDAAATASAATPLPLRPPPPTLQRVNRRPLRALHGGLAAGSHSVYGPTAAALSRR